MSAPEAKPATRPHNAPFDLSGRVAIVTGGSAGIGLHCATVLAAAGATVITGARRVERIHAAAEHHPRVIPVRVDVTVPEQRATLVSDTLRSHGRLDILVNNAGTSSVAPAESMELEEFRRTVDLNLEAVFDLSRIAARPMLEAATGSIINIASIFGLVGSAPLKQAAYAATKGAVVNLTRHLAGEWAPHGLRVNAIAPGFIETEMTSELLSDEVSRRWIVRNTPAGRVGQLSDLDGPLLLLAGDGAAYINGQTLPVDGGWTAR